MCPGQGSLTNHPMSESTGTSADGGTSDTLNVEDLFATDDTDISIDDGESTDRTTTASTDATPGTGRATPAAEDTTADELFAQLRDEHDDAEQAHAVDDVTDESPEVIMARADEETEHVDQIDDSIRADEGALDELLLTERREADGFRWVETETDDASDDVAGLFGGDGSETDGTQSDGSDGEQRPATEGAADGDDFSLATGTEDSFEARAATFDADDIDAADFDADATAFEDAGGAEDASDAGGSEDDDDDDGSDGLAARIRSILTG